MSESRPGNEEGVELAGLLEEIKPSQGGDDPLSRASAFPAVLNDLEVGACAGGLGTKEHGDLANVPP